MFGAADISRDPCAACAALHAVSCLGASDRTAGPRSIAKLGWWERDYVTQRVSLSEEVQRIFGIRPVDLPGWQDRWLDLIHPDDRPKAAAHGQPRSASTARYDVEYRVIRPDGAARVVHSQGDVTRDESGRPLRQFGVLQDITERRRAEDELSEVKERFRVLPNCRSPESILRRRTASSTWPRHGADVRLCRRRIVGPPPFGGSDCPQGSPLGGREHAAAVAGREELRYEFRGLRKDGSVFPVEVHGRRIEQAGKIAVLGTICRSIIEAHGGRLRAEPNSPHGAVFRFSLPAEG